MTELSSWNDTPTKQAIVDFVESAAKDVPPEERVAVFDNDGTLWCEKPMPIELGFILQRLASMAEEDASLRNHQPWKAAHEQDHGWLGGVITKHYAGDDSDVKVLLGGILRAFAGMSVDDYQVAVAGISRRGAAPDARPGATRLQLPAHDRAPALPGGERVHVLHRLGRRSRLHAAGHACDLRDPARARHRQLERPALQESENGGSVVYLAQPDVFDDGPIKPVRIWSRIGRRPILAVGNSNGDIPMLRFASHPSRPSLSMLIDHDDGEREFAYRGGAEDSLKQAGELGWTVVSVKNDWAKVFAD